MIHGIARDAKRIADTIERRTQVSGVTSAVAPSKSLVRDPRGSVTGFSATPAGVRALPIERAR
jgi:hypothetical protein